MPDTFISDLRQGITDLLRAEQALPVYGFLPDDLAHLPVLVVGRPGKDPAGHTAVMTMSLDVTLVGRRLGDEDASAELDAHGDMTFNVLGGTRGVKIGERLAALDRDRPASVLIAGLEYPAYVFTVTYDVATC